MLEMAKTDIASHNQIVEQSIYTDTFPLCCQQAATNSIRGKKNIDVDSGLILP